MKLKRKNKGVNTKENEDCWKLIIINYWSILKKEKEVATLENSLEKLKNMSDNKVASCENFERKECKKMFKTRQ